MAELEPTSQARTATAKPGLEPSRVYFFQPAIQHYRIPFWDSIVERAKERYRLTVLGPLENGAAFGGGTRSYFRQTPLKSLALPGLGLEHWPEALQIVRRERPNVVIVAANPRNVTCWKLPASCRQTGAACVAHSKVHSSAGVPTFIMNPLKRRLFRDYDFAICYGKQSRQELLELGFPEQRVRVAQNTIDTRRIFQHREQIAARAAALKSATSLNDKRVLLCVGRMDAEKRHADLLAAWPRLRDIDTKMVLVLVGGGPMLDEIRGRARSIDPHRIIVTGRVPEGDDYAWIAASDITVFPGAVGLAINQSLALGKPTIIADETGSDSEILEHEVTGWRYSRGNVDALVATVSQALRDEPGRLRIGANAERIMRQVVTIENMADVFHATILDAIEVNRARTQPQMNTHDNEV